MKHQIALITFKYKNPKTNEFYSVQRGWPCKDEADAELTVRYYGMKTGALEAHCVIEEIDNEEIKQAASSTATKEAHQTQPIT